jgi:hypothetical protein
MSCPSCRSSVKLAEIEKYDGICKICFRQNQSAVYTRRHAIPSRWRSSPLEPYAQQASSYEGAFAWLETPKEGWLYIYGPSGVGKTHLAGVVANRYIKDASLYWLSYYDFIFASYTGKNKFFGEMKKVSMIIVDGFGAVGSVPTMMGAILDYALNHEVRMVFTSQVYLLTSQNQEKLIKPSDRMEPYIAELLVEGISSYLLMEGENLRLARLHV